MLRTRIIPTLLLRNESLIKTVKFDKFTYIGDPANTVRIFNELEVDELLFLDVTASQEKRKPNIKILSDIAKECFMPLGYGGGITTLDDAKMIFDTGFEKISLNTSIIKNPTLITQIAKHYGSQAVIASIDVKRNLFGTNKVCYQGGKKRINKEPIEFAQMVADYGAGEILLTSVDREGSWSGFDIELVSKISSSVNIPVIAHGGAGNLSHILDVIRLANASAVALGSMVVFQKKGMGVLINYPDELYKIDQLIKDFWV